MSADQAVAPFAERLLFWFDRHGRHDLPWQHPRTPYRVWVSEVMLQQTQVATVIAYFNRFMAKFPTLHDLAQASMDEVLALWSGLGYYARARNLHAAARVMAQQGIPETLAHWLALPGVGSSTAAAIMAQAFDAPATILDGNVKRVIARHAGISAPIEQSATVQTLYRIAKENTPETRLADYTQAIMDLGATLCTRTRPGCAQCPVGDDCVAYRTDRVDELPVRRRRQAPPTRAGVFLLIRDMAGRVQLVRRPPVGIWGGLWCLPEYRAADEDAAPTEPSVDALAQHLSTTWSWTLQGDVEVAARFEHRFTHYVLDATILSMSIDRALEPDEIPGLLWLDLHDFRLGACAPGLPTPIQRLLMDGLAGLSPCPLPPVGHEAGLRRGPPSGMID